MIKAILFDMNNVIENFEEFRGHVLDLSIKVLMNAGLFINYKEAKSLINKVRNGLIEKFGDAPYEHHYHYWKEFLIRCRRNPINYKEIENVYDLYLEEYLHFMKPYPDVKPTLRRLKKDYRLGIIANGNPKRCYLFLEKNKLANFFQVITVSGETAFKKPEPFLFLYSLSNLNCLPNETIMVGDRYDTDVVGAKKLGICTIRVKRGAFGKSLPFKKDEVPDFEIDSLNEIHRILGKLKKETTDLGSY